MEVPVELGESFRVAGTPDVVVQGDYVAPNAGRNYDVSADGQRFLMIRNAASDDEASPQKPQINVVLNWFTELRERVPAP